VRAKWKTEGEARSSPRCGARRRGETEVAHGLGRGDARGAEDRIEGRDQWHRQPDCNLHGQHARRNGESSDIKIEQVGHELRQRLAAQRGQGHRDDQAEHAEHQHHAEIDAHDLVVACADRLHDAHLPHLLRQQRLHRIHDQQPAQAQRQVPQDRQHQQHRLNGLSGRVLARRRDVGVAHGPAALFDLAPDFLGQFVQLVTGGIRRGRNHVELVEVAREAEPVECCAVDITDGHAGPGSLHLAGVVDCSRNAQHALPAVRRLQQHGVANLRAHPPQRGALDQQLAFAGRPRPALRPDLAGADGPEVGVGVENQVAPLRFIGRDRG